MIPRVVVALGCTLIVAAGVVAASVSGGSRLSSLPRSAAFGCAALSLLCSGLVAAMLHTTNECPSGAPRESSAVSAARLTALLSAVLASTLLVLTLGIRIVYVVVDLLHVYPSEAGAEFGYDMLGLWSLGLLLTSCVISQVSTRDPQLPACTLLIATVATVWVSLSAPVYRMASFGGVEQAGASALLMVSLAALLVAAGLFAALAARRNRPGEKVSAPAGSASVSWPGFDRTCGSLALALIILAAYQLAVPLPLSWGGFRGAAGVQAVSAALGACGCYLLISPSWNARLADAVGALGSLSLCGAAVAVLPEQPVSLVERYPMVFNAMIVALAIAVAICTWSVATCGAGCSTPSIRARFVPLAKRFAFIDAVFALTVAGLMALWPRMRSIGIPDDSLGRVTAGFGANLFLLLVMLWCSRRLKRMTLHILTLLALLSAAGFMVMRMRPFTPSYG